MNLTKEGKQQAKEIVDFLTKAFITDGESKVLDQSQTVVDNGEILKGITFELNDSVRGRIVVTIHSI